MIDTNNRKLRTKRIETILKALDGNVLPMTVSQLFEKTGLSENVIYNLLISVSLRHLVIVNQISLEKVTYQLSSQGHCSTFEEKNISIHIQDVFPPKKEMSVLEFFYSINVVRCGEIYC